MTGMLMQWKRLAVLPMVREVEKLSWMTSGAVVQKDPFSPVLMVDCSHIIVATVKMQVLCVSM